MKGRERGQERKTVQVRARVEMMVVAGMARMIFFAVGRSGKNLQLWAGLNPCCFFLEGWETGAAWAEAEEASFYWGGCCSQLDQPKSSKLAGFGG